jgi:hypothetical protein
MGGVDRLEDTALDRATKGKDSELLKFMLRGRKPETYARHTIDLPPQRPIAPPLDLIEAKRRIEELGLPPLMIETDYEEVEGDG